jgi:hypothetical protein
MNLYWQLAGMFFLGIVIGYALRDLFWLNEDKDRYCLPDIQPHNQQQYSGRDLEAEEERSNEHAYQRGLAQRAQIKRLILENAQFRKQLDGQFSDRA